MILVFLVVQLQRVKIVIHKAVVVRLMLVLGLHGEVVVNHVEPEHKVGIDIVILTIIASIVVQIGIAGIVILILVVL